MRIRQRFGYFYLTGEVEGNDKIVRLMQTYTNTAVMGRSAFSSEHF